MFYSCSTVYLKLSREILILMSRANHRPSLPKNPAPKFASVRRIAPWFPRHPAFVDELHRALVPAGFVLQRRKSGGLLRRKNGVYPIERVLPVSDKVVGGTVVRAELPSQCLQIAPREKYDVEPLEPENGFNACRASAKKIFPPEAHHISLYSHTSHTS